jgi:hypothetical protein
LVRIGLLLGLLGGIAFAVAKLLGGERTGAPAPTPRRSAPWPPLTSDPAVPEPASTHAIPDPGAPRAHQAATPVPWVEPTEGACPATHPVKGKLSSKIFHLPGMQAYDRTKADRCYADAAQAEADGLRAAKR